MIKYTFSVKIKGSSNESYSYSLYLTADQENYPEQKLFTPEIRENMRNNLQTLSSCKITDSHLNQMIKTWIEDIREGYRDSTITLALPSLIPAKISNLNETGNQDLPALLPPDLSEIEPVFGMLPPLSFY